MSSLSAKAGRVCGASSGLSQSWNKLNGRERSKSIAAADQSGPIRSAGWPEFLNDVLFQLRIQGNMFALVFGCKATDMGECHHVSQDVGMGLFQLQQSEHQVPAWLRYLDGHRVDVSQFVVSNHLVPTPTLQTTTRRTVHSETWRTLVFRASLAIRNPVVTDMESASRASVSWPSQIFPDALKSERGTHALCVHVRKCFGCKGLLVNLNSG